MAAGGSALHERWVGLVAGALKADDPEAAVAALRSTTYDGITVEPLYTAADAVDERAIGRPGSGPLVRGRRPEATRVAGWDVRSLVDATAGPGRAREELERGATSVWVDLRRLPAAGVDELDGALAAALDGVLLDAAPVVLAAGPRWPAAAAGLAELWSRAGATPAAGGSLGADPFGAWAADRAATDLDAEVAALGPWTARLAEAAPGVSTVTVDGTAYHEAGAADAQELGLVVAAAVATLRALVDAGGADPFGALDLRLTATADQFATIAKLRAARLVWSRVAGACGTPAAAAATRLHAVMSTAMMTAYDPAVNMLRGTVACFAAGVAGADAVTIHPFDTYAAADEPSELGRRLARNTQTVLALEAHLARVIDPAGGSWYVERLTAATADAAWAVFQEVESVGGFRAAVKAGLVAERIAAVRARRDADVDHRRAPLTGLSEFPDAAAGIRPAPVVMVPSPADGSLGRHRWGERFEALRRRVDEHAARTGARPLVYLATLGGPGDHTARATFAKNLVEVAGVAAATGPVEGFAASGARVAVVCSSNAVYAAEADGAIAALTAAGATRVYVAGREPVVAGGDALATLTGLVELLGVGA